ncbi:MAG: hypothetical protein EXR72_17155 [Myxococcales bacterium]|nr:hypothetical protein [Myxococcales bacterium]
MKFLDLFRPAWKHSDASVRLEAVRRLGDPQIAIRARIARHDGDSHVQWAATRKLRDPDLLAEIAGADADPAIRKDAAERASLLQVNAATSQGMESLAALERRLLYADGGRVEPDARQEAMRRRAIARLTEPRAIAAAARSAEDPLTRRLAVLCASDPGVLRDIAVRDPDAGVGMAALDRVIDQTDLEAIAGWSQSAKVRAAARARIVPVRRAGPPEASLPPVVQGPADAFA